MWRTNAEQTDQRPLRSISVTDPTENAAVSTSILDTYSWVIITTTTTWNAQVLQNPTNTTEIKRFSVINNDTSTNTISINWTNLWVWETTYFIWDGTAWTNIWNNPAETATTIWALIWWAGDATPNNTDFVATSLTAWWILKKITWTNVKAFLKTYFDTLYESALWYTSENVANKSTTLDTDKASDTKYSSVKSIYDWAIWLFATLTWTQTLTNKRITERTNTIASSATPTPAWDTTDEFTVTALAANATFAAPTWTPTEWQVLLIRIKDDWTARTLAWNAIYRASSDLALPSTTIISKTLYLQFVYNNTDSKFDLLWLLNNF